MTLIDSGNAGGMNALNMGAKGVGLPFLPGELGLEAGLDQSWVLTTAVQRYRLANFPLPLPLSLAERYPGPAEVFINVLSFDNSRSPRQLLASSFYNHVGWPGTVQIHSRSNAKWLTTRVDSLSNGGMGEFVLQGAQGDRWIEIAVIGFDLTLNEARGLAEATTG